ncbi:nuclear pore complex protein Nup50-like [Oppia nitens]|uniref:nuclear pore complex protein Nup50-like n=1 Tax=Oppia nitens TaxID=1686743 RepID=UPI0023D988DD|nr:nuclear pore complex protein Nup50-like [Oppia nitens]
MTTTTTFTFKPNLLLGTTNTFGSLLSSSIGSSSGGGAQQPSTSDGNDDDTDEPPKVESVEHRESDAVYTKKCKLYFKNGQQLDREGCGLSVYQTGDPDADKAQLLMRADNTFGTFKPVSTFTSDSSIGSLFGASNKIIGATDNSSQKSSSNELSTGVGTQTSTISSNTNSSQASSSLFTSSQPTKQDTDKQTVVPSTLKEDTETNKLLYRS